MSEEKQDYAKWEHVADTVAKGNLTPGQAIALVDEVIGEPSFEKLKEDKVNCACGNSCAISTFPIVDTGITKSLYNVCKDCTKPVGELAHLCCIKCKSTVGHMYPHKTNVGFEFEKGKFYHIEKCPYCSPNEKGRADILEYVVFCRLNKIPTKSDPEYK